MSDPMAHLADFVLKLKFLGSDAESSQIRRVRLPRICNNHTGAISYEELVGLAISFVIPEKPAHAADFQVKLTYKDVDDDCVVIGSSEELLDAIDQFKDQRVLRITAEVKRTTKAKPPPQQPVGAVSSSLSRAVANECESNDAGVQAGSATSATTSNATENAPVLQNVVESVVNIILNAAVAINGRQDAQPSAPTPVFYTPEGVLSEPNEMVPSLETPRAAASEEPPTEVAPPAETTAAAPTEEVQSEPMEQGTEEKEEERPFIHGRHTCDCCLTTPIVGKRFHALNMADYDLCSKCHSNHGGGEIQFESVELERDRHLQSRWHRRRERMNNSNGRGSARRFGPRPHHARWGPGPRRGQPNGPPPPPNGHQPPPCHPPHHGPRGFRGPPPPPPGPGPLFTSWKGKEEQKASEDNAMAMAIKLSLQDAKAEAPAVKPKDPPQPTAPVETLESKAPKSVSSTASTKSAATAESKAASVTKDVVEEERSVEPALVEAVTERKAQVKTAPEPSAPMEEEAKLTSPSASVSEVQVETVEVDENEDEEEISVTSEPFVVRMPSSDGSFASDVSGIRVFGSNAPSAPDIRVFGSNAPSAPAQEGGSKESSFTSDAAGNGEFANMLGETLDKCAEAIDQLVGELDRTSLDSSSTASSYVGVTDEAEESVVEETEEAATEGATILESVGVQGQGSDDKTEERSEDDWHVVADQVGSDEELARAAQMIGSALFNSDMRSSGEVMSVLTGSASDEISHASSALTSVPSVSTQVAAAQRQRWAPQLAQLRTLGIDDDARCVEILERLTAANIGCDSSDEVSVSAVVNELWK